MTNKNNNRKSNESTYSGLNVAQAHAESSSVLLYLHLEVFGAARQAHGFVFELVEDRVVARQFELQVSIERPIVRLQVVRLELEVAHREYFLVQLVIKCL